MNAVAVGRLEGIDCTEVLAYADLVASSAAITRDLVGALEDMRARSTQELLDMNLAQKLGSAHFRFISAARQLRAVKVNFLSIVDEKAIELLNRRGASYANRLHDTLDIGLRLRSEPRLSKSFDRECQRTECQLSKFAEALDERYSSLLILARGGGREQEAGAGVAGLPITLRPTWLAKRMHGWTKQILSPAARELFADELLDELYALAENRDSRRAQAACALRQFVGAWRLRRETRLSKSSISASGME